MTKVLFGGWLAVVLIMSLLLGGAALTASSGASAGALLAETSHESAQTAVTVDCGVDGQAADGAAQAVRAAGWPQAQWLQATKVIGAESTFDPRAGNQLADGRTHRGLFQISSLHLNDPKINPRGGDLRYDPVENARMALRLWERADRKWDGPWLASRDHWNDPDTAVPAQQAVAGLTGAPCAPPDGDLLADVGAGSCSTGKTTTIATPKGSTQVCAVGSTVVDVRLAPFIEQMYAAAAADGLSLGGGGWRSHEKQKHLYAQNCRGGRCMPPTAKPGTSQHEYALAVDLTCNGGSAFAFGSSPCYPWMVRNAARFRLKQLPSEKWHWSTTGG